MPKYAQVLDTTDTTDTTAVEQVFKALSDPTRRAVVERLGAGPAATTELATGFDMALPSFVQHLGVLEDSGLVTSTKAGRVRTYRLTPAPLRAAEGWLSEQRDLWERRLDQLDQHLYEMERQQRPNQEEPRP